MREGQGRSERWRAGEEEFDTRARYIEWKNTSAGVLSEKHIEKQNASILPLLRVNARALSQ